MWRPQWSMIRWRNWIELNCLLQSLRIKQKKEEEAKADDSDDEEAKADDSDDIPILHKVGSQYFPYRKIITGTWLEHDWNMTGYIYSWNMTGIGQTQPCSSIPWLEHDWNTTWYTITGTWLEHTPGKYPLHIFAMYPRPLTMMVHLWAVTFQGPTCSIFLISGIE